MTVDSASFYGEYHGHLVEDLRAVHSGLRTGPRVWFVGDSSLDNKFYVPRGGYEAAPGYSELLRPAESRADVCYWLQGLVHKAGINLDVINAAVEESTLGSRNRWLWPQDEFVRENIGPEDVLVCSVGGNDVALAPSVWTAMAAGRAVYLNGDEMNENAWGMPHFRKLFKTHTEQYLAKLVAKTKPRLIVVCMIYFPHEDANVGSWANPALRALRYDANPSRLQNFIRAVYQAATCDVQVEDVQVVPCALYEAMDGKKGDLYVARVEPSEQGGRAVAELLLGKIRAAL